MSESCPSAPANVAARSSAGRIARVASSRRHPTSRVNVHPCTSLYIHGRGPKHASRSPLAEPLAIMAETPVDRARMNAAEPQACERFPNPQKRPESARDAVWNWARVRTVPPGTKPDAMRVESMTHALSENAELESMPRHTTDSPGKHAESFVADDAPRRRAIDGVFAVSQRWSIYHGTVVHLSASPFTASRIARTHAAPYLLGCLRWRPAPQALLARAPGR